MGQEPQSSPVVILACGRSLLRAGGMSLLQRLLCELDGTARSGRTSDRVLVCWNDAEAASRACAELRVPVGLSVEHRIEPAAEHRPLAGALTIPGDLLVTPGGLAGWLEQRRRDRTPPEEESGVPALPGRIASPRQIRWAERRLFASLTKETDGFGARFLNRPISTRLSRWLVRAGVTPNQWTGLLLALTAVAAVALAFGTDRSFLAGILLFNAVSILDGCDGEIARVTYRHSDIGARLDTIGDMGGHALFAFAAGVGLARQAGLAAAWRTAYLTEGFVTALGVLVAAGAAARLHGGTHEGTLLGFGDRVVAATGLRGWPQRVGGFVSEFTRQDTYRWLWVLLALAGVRGGILHLLAMGVAAHLVAALFLWLRLREQRPAAAVADLEGGEIP